MWRGGKSEKVTQRERGGGGDRAKRWKEGREGERDFRNW